MALPAIGGFVVFTVGPMIASGIASFTDWSIGGQISFVGLDDHVRMCTADPQFVASVGSTIYYTLGAVPLTLLLAFGAALLLNRDLRGRSFFRVVYYLPTLVPLVPNAMLWIWLFNPDFGLFNQLLRSVGLSGSSWLYEEATAVPSLIVMTAWGFGNAAMIFLAGLQGVPRHLYEAAEIDGGGAWVKFRHVTLPMMTPTILFNLVLGVIGSVQIFVQAAVMTQGGPNNATLFYVYYLYRTAFTNNEMGYASALAWVLFVIILVVTAVLFRTSRRWVFYELEGAR